MLWWSPLSLCRMLSLLLSTTNQRMQALVSQSATLHATAQQPHVMLEVTALLQVCRHGLVKFRSPLQIFRGIARGIDGKNIKLLFPFLQSYMDFFISLVPVYADCPEAQQCFAPPFITRNRWAF